jgi:hypothetical protein
MYNFLKSEVHLCAVQVREQFYAIGKNNFLYCVTLHVSIKY